MQANTFHVWISSPAKVGTVTSRLVSLFTRKRNTIIWDTRSVSTVRADRPARDLFVDQKEMSDWKARHSNSRWSREASIVRASRPSEVSEINLVNKATR